MHEHRGYDPGVNLPRRPAAAALRHGTALSLLLACVATACGTPVTYTAAQRSELLAGNTRELYHDALWRSSMTGIAIVGDRADVTTSNPLWASRMCADVAAAAFDSHSNRIGISVVRVVFDQTGGELADCSVPAFPHVRVQGS
jgi:hypothetical protein